MSQRRLLIRPVFLAPLAVLVLAAVAVPVTLGATADEPVVAGVADGAFVGADDLTSLTLRIDTGGDGPPVAEIDGAPVPVEREAGAYVVHPKNLKDGEHELAVTVDRGFPYGSATTTRAFTVDATPPEIALEAPTEPVGIDADVTVRGSVAAGATVTSAGAEIEVTDGAFTLDFASPPAGVEVVATDRAGNTSTATIDVPVRRPYNRAVHLTALAWSADFLREPVLDMIRAGKIDAVEVDIKDEAGAVGYDSQVPLAQKSGAAKGHYDAERMLEKLHSMGVSVIGRIVAFHDPTLAEWAWQNGKRDMVIQTPQGQPYAGGYGDYAFTNFAEPKVRQYNIALAVEAAKLGFDDILYDYVRRPDGARESMVFPGLSVSPSKSVASFLGEAQGKLRPLGAYLGACVFGIAATRPEQIAQNIPMMAKHLDYAAPMVYPSHWGPGEYDVAHPNRQPYAIVKRSLLDFQKAVEGTSAIVQPWLQDFSLGVSYGPAEVEAQIRAAQDLGIDGFLLWNAGAEYTAAALAPIPGS